MGVAPVSAPRRGLLLGGALLATLLLLAAVITLLLAKPSEPGTTPAPGATSSPGDSGATPLPGSLDTSQKPSPQAAAPQAVSSPAITYPGGLTETQWNALPPHLQKRTVALISYSVGQLDRIGRNPGRPLQDLEAVHEILHNYQLTVKSRRGLPIGTHEETVASLRGNNPWGLPFLPADHPNLTADNQLLDRWQTPFFFHALAADQVQIRSAGPDKEMWTDDDLTYPPDYAGTP